MSWQNFLKVLCNRREYNLTLPEIDVVMCLSESLYQIGKSELFGKSELLEVYNKSHPNIEKEAFTQRLRNIYRKFDVKGNGHKLPQLHRYLTEKYGEYRNQEMFFSMVGLANIHPNFPRDKFAEEIEKVIRSEDREQKKVDILQTFAPNLNDYCDHLGRCIRNGVHVRVLLAWPYSEAARLREDVLKRYAEDIIADDFNIRDSVIANLETIEKIVRTFGDTKLLNVKLYDALPSLAIYRAGNYMLAGLFLHGALAINTFQLEINLSASNQLIVNTLQNDFELLWRVSRKFHPDPKINWRNDLKILFTT